MTDPSYSALRAYHRTITALYDDPDVTGDLLLVGLWLARATVLNEPEKGTWSMATIARDLFGKGNPYTITGMGTTKQVESEHITRVNTAIGRDRPRYDPFTDNPRTRQGTCTAPMVRRETRCGRNATTWGFFIDVDTGRQVAVGACRRHQDWWKRAGEENRAAVAAAGEFLPHPPANVGGALARHIVGVNWPKLWKTLDSDWTPPAEGASTRKPRLQVLSFEPSGEEPGTVVAPVLRVVRGGWS